MRKPERSTYTPVDFREWKESGGLILSPKFQRRGVWTTPARSYLIDTLLLGMPVPPIYLRVTQHPNRDRVVREVIDGQQRIAAVLDYMNEQYALSKNIDSPCGGKRFKELDKEDQDRIAHYPFICEVFYGIEDPEVLQIFARMNTHSVKLNGQELRNGRFFGPFKRAAYALALEHLEFWRKKRIFTENGIARMSEVEMTSELMIMQVAGLQDKKKSIDEFYERYDDNFPQRKKVELQFRATVDAINDACGDFLALSEFRRPPLFYSLYGATFHHLFGVPGLNLESPLAGRLVQKEQETLGDAIRKLSSFITIAKQDEDIPLPYDRFVAACLRQTDNLRPRQIRVETLYNEAFGH